MAVSMSRVAETAEDVCELLYGGDARARKAPVTSPTDVLTEAQKMRKEWPNVERDRLEEAALDAWSDIVVEQEDRLAAFRATGETAWSGTAPVVRAALWQRTRWRLHDSLRDAHRYVSVGLEVDDRPLPQTVSAAQTAAEREVLWSAQVAHELALDDEATRIHRSAGSGRKLEAQPGSDRTARRRRRERQDRTARYARGVAHGELDDRLVERILDAGDERARRLMKLLGETAHGKTLLRKAASRVAGAIVVIPAAIRGFFKDVNDATSERAGQKGVRGYWETVSQFGAQIMGLASSRPLATAVTVGVAVGAAVSPAAAELPGVPELRPAPVSQTADVPLGTVDIPTVSPGTPDIPRPVGETGGGKSGSGGGTLDAGLPTLEAPANPTGSSTGSAGGSGASYDVSPSAPDYEGGGSSQSGGGASFEGESSYGSSSSSGGGASFEGESPSSSGSSGGSGGGASFEGESDTGSSGKASFE